MGLVLFIAAALRLSGIGAFSQYLLFDEAYYAVDAHSLIDQPRLTPFFPGNFGRESGWMYVQVPFQLIFGATPLAPHLAVAFVGILTVAAMYWLCRQCLSETASFWAAATLSVLYWHVNLSYVAFRALLFPLVGALMFGLLLKAIRKNGWRDWVMAAIALGLFSYTYFAARLWIALALAILIVCLSQSRFRSKAFLTMLIAVLIATPLILYMLQSPEANNRISGSAQLAPNQIVANSMAWLNGFVQQGRGDQDFMHSIPGRPVFDPPLAVAWAFGGVLSLIMLVRGDHRLNTISARLRARWQVMVLWAMGLLALSASLLSDEAPDTLRAVGFVIFIAALCGIGFGQMEQWLRDQTRLPSWSLPALILTVIAVSTIHDFFGNWLVSPIRYYNLHRHINQAVDYVKATDHANTPLYFSPEPMQFDNQVDPVIRYRAIDLRPRHVGTVSTNTCLALPPQALYAAHTSQEPTFERNMQRWATLNPQKTFVYVADAATTYTQTIYSVAPNPQTEQALSQPPIQLGADGLNELELHFLDTPTALHGGTQQMYLALRPTLPLTNDYRVSVYLIPLTATISTLNDLKPVFDDWYCRDYPGPNWQTNEHVIRSISFDLPALPTSSRYALAVRIYEGIPFKYSRELHVEKTNRQAQILGLPIQEVHVAP